MKNIKKLLINSNSFDASSLINISSLSNLKVLQLNGNLLGDACM